MLAETTRRHDDEHLFLSIEPLRDKDADGGAADDSSVARKQIERTLKVPAHVP